MIRSLDASCQRIPPGSLAALLSCPAIPQLLSVRMGKTHGLSSACGPTLVWQNSGPRTGLGQGWVRDVAKLMWERISTAMLVMRRLQSAILQDCTGVACLARSAF